MLERPTDLFDRDLEWDQLSQLVESPAPGMRLAVVSGRRRHGKSYLLRRLVNATDGIYHQAFEVERHQALTSFAADVAPALGLPAAALSVDSWEPLLRLALGLPARGAPAPRNLAAKPRLLVIDELPYLLPHSPELPSVLQLLHDEAQSAGYPPSTVVLCGSALSVMVDLLSGSKPLRGRAQVEMRLHSFDFRAARDYWQIADDRVAFQVDAILGGTPGYRSLVSGPLPADIGGLPAWVARELLTPSRALFNEKDYLLREDPRITDKALYNSVLRAVAQGAHTTKSLGTAVARDYNKLRHPLGVLESAGFLLRSEDVLTARRPLLSMADPIIRFSENVVEPYRVLLEEGDPTSAWQAAAPSYSSRILGPHFEHLARAWTASYSGDRWGTRIGVVGNATVDDPSERTQQEIDVVALARGDRAHDPGARIVVLGEAKSSNRKRTAQDLARLALARQRLRAKGANVHGAHLALFSREGFDDELLAAASRDDEIHLIDLAELYGG